MLTQQTIQFGDRGSIPTTPQYYRIKQCEFKHFRHILEGFHYKKAHIGGGISYNLGLFDVSKIVGGVVVGKMRHTDKYSGEGNVVELRRMALLPECPKNTASYFLSKVIWWLKKNTDINVVYSFADMTVGHKGTIYQASNFEFVRETPPTVHVFWEGKRYHPRSLSIDRPYSYRLREAVKDGSAVVEKGKPKRLYRYKIK